jgi:hypothetical protein
MREYREATANHGKFNGPHEGYAVILEELDELWDNVKKNRPAQEHYDEAKQVAAMALRYMHDIC